MKFAKAAKHPEKGRIKIVLTSRIEKKKRTNALQFDVRCKAIGRNFDCECGFLLDKYIQRYRIQYSTSAPKRVTRISFGLATFRDIYDYAPHAQDIAILHTEIKPISSKRSKNFIADDGRLNERECCHLSGLGQSRLLSTNPSGNIPSANLLSLVVFLCRLLVHNYLAC